MTTKPPLTLVSLYTTMCRIREFERRVARHARAGDVHGFVHISTGQEAVSAGACAALSRGDVITTTHRGHGHCIAMGSDPEAMMAELFGRANGLCGGMGGSMHIADPQAGIFGANGVVGAGIPIAAGAALAARTRRDRSVAAAFFGEGAVHCGAFHEGLVLAVAWRAPLVLVCEHNGWAEFTDTAAWGGPSPAERGRAYGMPACAVDGSDPIAVHEAVAAAVGRARSGEGPSFVEARTTRLSGHYEGDAQRYRTADELARSRDLDPISLARGQLLTEHATDLDTIDAAIAQEMDRAVAYAKAQPYPDPERALGGRDG